MEGTLDLVLCGRLGDTEDCVAMCQSKGTRRDKEKGEHKLSYRLLSFLTLASEEGARRRALRRTATTTNLRNVWNVIMRLA